MDEQQIAEYLQHLHEILMALSMAVRVRKDDALSRELLPLIEGTVFGKSEYAGALDFVDALREEFPVEEDEEESDEDDAEACETVDDEVETAQPALA